MRFGSQLPSGRVWVESVPLGALWSYRSAASCPCGGRSQVPPHRGVLSRDSPLLSQVQVLCRLPQDYPKMSKVSVEKTEGAVMVCTPFHLGVSSSPPPRQPLPSWLWCRAPAAASPGSSSRLVDYVSAGLLGCGLCRDPLLSCASSPGSCRPPLNPAVSLRPPSAPPSA